MRKKNVALKKNAFGNVVITQKYTKSRSHTFPGVKFHSNPTKCKHYLHLNPKNKLIKKKTI